MKNTMKLNRLADSIKSQFDVIIGTCIENADQTTLLIECSKQDQKSIAKLIKQFRPDLTSYIDDSYYEKHSQFDYGVMILK